MEGGCWNIHCGYVVHDSSGFIDTQILPLSDTSQLPNKTLTRSSWLRHDPTCRDMVQAICKFTLYQLLSATTQAPHVGSNTKYGSTLKFQDKPLKLREPQDMVGRSLGPCFLFFLPGKCLKPLNVSNTFSCSCNTGLHIQLSKSSPRWRLSRNLFAGLMELTTILFTRTEQVTLIWKNQSDGHLGKPILVLVSTAILGSESLGTHDHILLFYDSGSPATLLVCLCIPT
jgi:hypothetical protein